MALRLCAQTLAWKGSLFNRSKNGCFHKVLLSLGGVGFGSCMHALRLNSCVEDFNKPTKIWSKILTLSPTPIPNGSTELDSKTGSVRSCVRVAVNTGTKHPPNLDLIFLSTKFYLCETLKQRKRKLKTKHLPTFSFSVSREEVASSRRSILGFLTRALAIAILCFWPPLNCFPLLPIQVL